MAEPGGENIGGLNVSVGADYSQLLTDFQSMQSAATTAGAAVAGSFTSAAEGVTTFDEAVQKAVDSGATLADAISQANAQFGTFTEDAQGAGEAAQTAGTSLGEMAQQMAAVGEALVITEGLKDLGSEALGAADAITHASIALTTITGSGDTAKETIEGLEQLGMADGLAMPSLLTAATRMQQILGPATDVTAELKMVADGAAVMGTDIETAAQKFDQIASAGTASARTLTALGISLGGLAAAFNTVESGANETASTVAAAFKELDQSARIEVLNTALSKLGGTAEQVAQQTFGGQWQQLANSWEAVMVQAGQALIPVISEITQFLRLDVAPFLKEIAEDFNSLPGPVRDTAVALALVTAALVPVTGIVAAAAVGINGLGEALELLGIKSGEAATAQDVEAVASEAQGAAAAEAIPGVAGLGEAAAASGESFGLLESVGIGTAGFLGGVLVVGLTAAALGFTDLQKSIKSAQSAYGDQTLAQAAAAAQLNQYIQDLKTADLSVEDAAEAAKYFQDQFDAGTISAAKFAEALKNIATAQNNLKLDELATVAQQFDVGLRLTVDTAHKATDQFTLLSQVLADAKKNFDDIAAKYQANTATAQQYVAAQNAVKTAQDALNASLGPTPGSMEAIDIAAQKLASSTGFVVNAQQEEANALNAANNSLNLAQTAYATSVAKLDLLTAAVNDAKAAYDGSVKSQQNVIAAEQNLQKAYAESQKAQSDLNTTASNYADTMETAVQKGQKDALVGLQQLSEMLGPTMSAFTGLDGVIAGLQEKMPGFGVIVTNISTGPLAGLQNALQEANDKVAMLSEQMANGENVGQQYEKALGQQNTALLNLNVAAAESATGLQGQTDAVSLATIAVAAAQAKYDTLNAAFQTNITLAPQVKAAQDALANAQKSLNDATSKGISLTNQLDEQYPQLKNDITDATTAIDAQTSSLGKNVAALNGVSAAVLGVEADMKAAFGNKTTGGPTVNVEQGYHLGGILSGAGDFGGQSYSLGLYADPSTIAAQAKVQETQLYDQGYTPQAIAKQMSLPLSQVLADLGLTAAQAGSTKSSANIIIGQSTVDLSGLPGGIGGGSGGSGSGTVSSGGSTFAGGSTISAAVDGGSYPAVTAHQAVGEVWAVAAVAGGPTGGGGGSSVITTSISNNVTGSDGASLQAATQAIGSVAQQIATNSGDLLPISQSLLQTAAATQQLATAVAGLVQRVDVGAGSSGTFKVTGGGGTAAPSGPVISTVGGGNPLGQYVPPSSTPIADVPGYNPFGPGSAGGGGSTTISVTVNAQGSIGLNSQQLNAQITAAVVNNLVPQLQTAGARLTR